ncbi:VOC family protein [Sulfitobacter sp. S190]|uniref:VOC family protein n=1 Tax=Sulfitobacter sp. S190 TaxID=2867022 RepID=UPI0021A7B60C|nr:VOC family protein [Sulfitobacter sp. S190]UWR23928.1 VOC family protein [Sulfitobacter sp. S190]
MGQRIAHVALIVADYDDAIAFYVGTLGFDLVADEYQPEQDKRWVVVRPSASSDSTSILLAKASSPRQSAYVGDQTGGRVFLFLQTDTFETDHARYRAAGVRFFEAPRHEPYGTVAVFEDLYGNRWDLIQFT